MDQRDLRSRVEPPAIAMLVVALLTAALGAVAIVAMLIAPGRHGGDLRPWPGATEIDIDPAILRTIELVSSGTMLVLGLVAAFGALQLLRRRRHAFGFGLASAILLCTPCLWPCCCPYSAVVGIWAIVVLMRDDVRAALSGEHGVPPAFDVPPPPPADDQGRDSGQDSGWNG